MRLNLLRILEDWADIDKDYEEKKEELEDEYEEKRSDYLSDNPEPDYSEDPEAFEEWESALNEIDAWYYYELDQLEQDYEDEQHSYEEELMDLVSKLYNKLDDFINEQNNENLEVTRSESHSMKKGRFNSEYFYITLEDPNHYFSYTIRFADHHNREVGYDAYYDIEKLEDNFDSILEEIKTAVLKGIKGNNLNESYSETDDKGNELSSEQLNYFKDSKVRDNNGKLKVVYHGSKSSFDEFSYEFIGNNGVEAGIGFYFTDNDMDAKVYGDNPLAVYLDMKKPLSNTKLTITKPNVKKLIRKADPTGEDGLSNFGDVNYIGYERLVDNTANQLLEWATNDIELIDSIAYDVAGKEYERVYPYLRELLGYDGIIVEKRDGVTHYIVFNKNQIKNITNKKPSGSNKINEITKIDNAKEVKISKKKKARINKRSGVPPSTAELNVYDRLQSPKSYDNYGNSQPYGTGGVASSQLSSGSGGTSGGVAPSSSGGITAGVKLGLMDIINESNNNVFDGQLFYHGTARGFGSFDYGKNRTELNNNFYGNGLFFVKDKNTAASYAYAARNQTIDKDMFIKEMRKLYPDISDIVEYGIKHGYSNAWEDYLLNKRFKGDEEAYYDFLNKDFDKNGNALNSLFSIAEYVEGNNLDAGREPDIDDVFNAMTGGYNRISEGVYEHMRELGFSDNVIPFPRVMTVKLYAKNVLTTNSRREAKNAQRNGYDGVIFTGDDLVNEEPEYVVFKPSQVKIVEIEDYTTIEDDSDYGYYYND